MGFRLLQFVVLSGDEKRLKRLLSTRLRRFKQADKQEAFGYSLSLGKLDIAEIFLPYIDVNFRESSYGNTALHWVAESKHVSAAEFLLDHGAEINIRTNGGVTPLGCAVQAEIEDAYDYATWTGHAMIPKAIMSVFLIEKGADVSSLTSAYLANINDIEIKDIEKYHSDLFVYLRLHETH